MSTGETFDRAAGLLGKLLRAVQWIAVNDLGGSTENSLDVEIVSFRPAVRVIAYSFGYTDLEIAEKVVAERKRLRAAPEGR